MAEKRKDNQGRNLKIGEYYDSKNKRYMFRKMIDGERITITAPDLVELRKQENDLLCRIDRGKKLNTRNARMALNAYFDFWMEHLQRAAGKPQLVRITNHITIHISRTQLGKSRSQRLQKQIARELLMKWFRTEKNILPCPI